MRAYSSGAVAPVRTQMRISISSAHAGQCFPDSRKRRLEIALVVIGERPERRDIDDLRLVLEPALYALPDEPVDRREDLTRSGRRCDQGMPASLDQRPGIGLRRGRHSQTAVKPLGYRRVEQRRWGTDTSGREGS